MAENSVEESTRRSGDYDRLILGTSHEGFLRRKVFGNLPTRIARRSRCPVIFVPLKEPGLKYEVQNFFSFFRELEQMGSPEETE